MCANCMMSAVSGKSRLMGSMIVFQASAFASESIPHWPGCMARPACEIKTNPVISVPDPVTGERVCAVVVAQPGAAPDLPELVGFLRDEQEVAAFKLPEKLVLLAQLPRNPLGKVLKRELRQLDCAPGVA